MSSLSRRRRDGPRGTLTAIYSIAFTIMLSGILQAGEPRPVATQIPIPLQIQIFLKIVTYDRAFDREATVSYRLGVVMRSNGEGDCERSFRQVTDALAGKTIFGRPLAPVKIMLRKGKLPRLEQTPDMLVLIGDWSDDGEIIAGYAKEHRLVTFGSDLHLLKSGIVVVLTLDGDKPVIHLNLSGARGVGADFHANFLKHCRVIR